MYFKAGAKSSEWQNLEEQLRVLSRKQQRKAKSNTSEEKQKVPKPQCGSWVDLKGCKSI